MKKEERANSKKLEKDFYHFLPVICLFLCILCAPVSHSLGAEGSVVRSAALPDAVVFVGPEKYRRLISTAKAKGWSSLPIGERVTQIGLALVGTPYKNFTLELSDRVETPCVNMTGMDCWTFFEIALGTARAIAKYPNPGKPDLLKMIELDRYRDGRCDGSFTSRLHHLEDWLYDNQRRGLVEDITPKLSGAKRLQRTMTYMATNWKTFRQLKANPSLVPQMAKIERDVSARGIFYVPKARVRSIEKDLRNGDIICIVTTWPGTYTSHVGLAYRDKAGVLRFLHASRTKRKVIVDSRLSDYLAKNSKHMGIMVVRPNEVSSL